MEDPPPSYSSYYNYPTGSEYAAATNQQIRNPRRDADRQGRRDGDGHRRDIDGQVRHGDRHRRDADRQGRRDADRQGRRDGDGHRRDIDGQVRHGDRHRRDADRQGRRDADGQGRRDADGHRRDINGQVRHGDRHRRDADRQGRRDADGHRRDIDGQVRHGDRHRRDADRQGRRDADGHRRDIDGQVRHGDRHRRDADRHADGQRRDVDGQGRHGDRHRRDTDGQGRDLDGHRQDVNIDFEVDNKNLIEGFQNASNTFSGFIDIMHDKKKLPWGFAQNTIYKLGLCTYFFVNLIYSIVATLVQRDQVPYHLVYMFISLIGFVIELVVIIVTTRKYCTGDGDDVSHNHGEFQGADEQVQAYYRHTRSVLVDYVISSIGEFLIYPTLICVLHGFINERSWKYDNGISGCNFILLVYSVIMDALYMKFYMIFLMIRVLCASYKKYDELARPTKVEWKRCYTPVYLSISLAFTTALTHWFMTGIIGVRIYVDNFTLDRDDTNSSIPNTGDYRVAPFTRYMIACAIFLPILSWITYIILNKLWFYEVYSAISQLKSADHMYLQDIWDEYRYVRNDKLIDFITNPLAYILIVSLMVSFIAYTVGTYLPDYDSTEYKVASSARDSIHILGFCFIGFFLLSNLQAAIIFTIIVLVIVVLILCALPILCVVLCYNQCCKKHCT